MKIVKCPKCGFDIQLNESEPVAVCEQCGAKFRNPIYVEPVIQEGIEPVLQEESAVQNHDLFQDDEAIEPVQTDDMFASDDSFEPVSEKAVKPAKEKAPKASNDKAPKGSKKTLIIVFSVIFGVILLAGFIMSAIGVSKVSNSMKLESIFNDFVDAGFTEVYSYSEYYYDNEYECTQLGEVYGSYYDNFYMQNYSLNAILFDSKESAEKFYDKKRLEIENDNSRNSSYYYSSTYIEKDIRIDGKIVYYGHKKAINKI